MIEKLKNHAPTIVVVVAALALFGLLVYYGNKPTSTKDPEIKVAQDDKNKSAAESKLSKQFAFTAQHGDSYTVLARKAVQDYAKASGVKLTKAHIIAAETVLAQNAGSPELAVGQKVTLKTTNVKDAVDGARALSASDLAAWETYVPYVQF